MNTRRRFLLALLFPLLLLPRQSVAHGFDPALLDLRERDHNRFEVRFKLPDTYAAPIPPTPLLPCAKLNANEPATTTRTRFLIDCGAPGLRGRAIAMSNLDGRTDVLVRINFLDGEEATGVLRADSDQFIPVITIHPITGAPRKDVFTTYARLGIAHILSGADHLLFLAALMLLVNGIASLAAAITAFTVAHSLALALAALGLLFVPPAPVEALIAASIVILALELARKPNPSSPPSLLRRAPALAAFAFGLLHGLGFAGALVATGLPPDHIPLALLSFNLGVEAGQLTFVTAMALPIWAWAHWTTRHTALRLAPAYVIGSVAAAWFFERVVGLFES